ncbi:MAG: HIT domain-containing protein [Candidatus Heimdallarchaeota archaeon]|nr:HIT domain-containing protein [Candidatus Heimdallarchaeota archaeon]
MEQLWAPWRMEYIEKPKSDEECFICDIVADKKENDKKNLVLYRGENALVILNRYPYIAGHLMIVPKKHTANLEDLSKITGLEMWTLTTKSIRLLKKAIHPKGFNVGINIGKVAGAGLKTHVHIHVVPRWSGDVNFMPILSNTRAISQALEETYEVLEKEKNIFEE